MKLNLPTDSPSPTTTSSSFATRATSSVTLRLFAGVAVIACFCLFASSHVIKSPLYSSRRAEVPQMSSTVLDAMSNPPSPSSTSTTRVRTPLSVTGPHQRDAPAQGWIDQGAVSSSADSSTAQTSFTLLLAQQNKDKLEQLLKEVSDPTSAKYGQYLTPQQLNDLTRPPAEQHQAVMDWLRSAFHLSTDDDVAAHTDTRVGDAIKVNNVSVADVEKAFVCTMHAFEEKSPDDPTGVAGIARPIPPMTTLGPAPHRFVPRHIYRCSLDTTPSIPANLASIVTGSVGIVDFPTRFHSGPRPHPVPVGPNPHIDPVRTVPVAGEVQANNVQQVNSGIHANVVSIKGKSSEQPQEKTESMQSGGQHETPTSIPVKPHQTFRTKEQLQHLAQELDREQLRK